MADLYSKIKYLDDDYIIFISLSRFGTFHDPIVHWICIKLFYKYKNSDIKYLFYVMLDSYHKIIAIGCNNIIYCFSLLKLRFIQKGRNK